MAHEINNPVSGVLNLSMLLQRMLKDDGVPQDRIPEFRKYLGQVTSETARVGRIVSDLLAFSRRGKPQRAPADLNRILRMTLSLVEHKMKLSNVAVETTLCEDLPAAPCDPSQIQQVVLNLVLNAAEATQSKTERRVTVSTAKGDGVVLLHVSDNGEGILPENLAKIFDPFFTTKPEGKGVGLGLAVSYGIVEAHGGDIEVKSTVGEGTTFTVSLPLVAAGRAGRRLRRGAGAPGMKYLYVAATEEVEREALAAVTARVAAEFGGPVRSMELGSVDFAFDAERRQYGSIPVLDMLLRRCPADAAQIAGGDGARSVHPGADVRLRTGAAGRPRGRGFPRAAAAGVLWPRRPIARFFWSGLTKRRSTRPAICSGWCTARNASARCRWPPPSGRSI